MLYFFRAGLHVRHEDLAGDALWVGAAFLTVMIPLRIALVAIHRRLALGETWREGGRIGVSMLPSLVFTLVLAETLRDTFCCPSGHLRGLVIYALDGS